MKLFLRLFGIWLLLGCAPVAWSQTTGPKIDRVDIKYVGPASVSEQFIRANIRLKAGDIYRARQHGGRRSQPLCHGTILQHPRTVDQADDGGVMLTYIVQVRPRITEIKIEGNKKLSASKIRKKITVKVGDPLDEQKLFTDARRSRNFMRNTVTPARRSNTSLNMDENAGRGTATFQITETAEGQNRQSRIHRRGGIFPAGTAQATQDPATLDVFLADGQRRVQAGRVRG